jgi:antitoxin HicB
MLYPAKFTHQKDARNIGVSFPDIPEALTVAENEADAMRQATDALESALDFYFEQGRPVPLPSAPKRGHRLIELPASVWATVLLFNEMLAQDVRLSELARRLSIPRQNVNRLLDPRHPTKIDNIEAALKVLGKRMEITTV